MTIMPRRTAIAFGLWIIAGGIKLWYSNSGMPITVSGIFWFFALAGIACLALGTEKPVCYFMWGVLLGATSNALAMITNGGKMPYTVALPPDPLHVHLAIAQMRLPWLCDILLGGTTSIGDFFILGSGGMGLGFLLGDIVGKN